MAKKTRFMQQAAIELGLKNITVVQTRVENWQAENQFDTIISRAFASIVDFIDSSSLHLSKKGQMLAMKGQFPKRELSTLPNEFIVDLSTTLKIPDVSGERCIIKIIKNT